MNILETLINLLKQDERLVSTEGDLLRNKIQELANKLDEKLIGLLYSDETMRTGFFKQINKVWLFDSHKFIRFINNKEFLPDSYTAFKNKIGLTDTKEEFIAEGNDVLLNRPYKDCILAGGQDVEDAKRDEIFYNEILGSDEIDRLLDPKIFTKFKQYDKKGKSDFGGRTKDEDGNIKDNLVIKGNNLLVLYSLEKKFAGLLDLIYIDPPYNTGGNGDTFEYNNKFKHSSRLTFMKNRLEIAKKLLKKDGVLIVAIDENEQAYLGVLLNEIFTDHETHCITIVHNPRGIQGTNFSYTNEFAFFVIPKGKKSVGNRKIQEDDIKMRGLRDNGGESDRGSAKNCFYPMIIENGEIVGFGDVVADNVHPKQTEKIGKQYYVYPIDKNGVERKWRYARQSVEKVQHLLNVREIKGGYDIDIGKDFGQYRTVRIDNRYDSNEYGTKLVKSLVPGCKFSFPKSLWNVYDCLYAIVANKKDAKILDFFGGSGTTAHAVLELNKEDGGSRQFIVIEQMDYVEEVTVPRIHQVMKNNGHGSFVYMEMMKDNQNYIDQINKSKKKDELLEIYKSLQNSPFVNYKIAVQKINETVKEFEALSLDEMKKLLNEMVDKNSLYLNQSDINEKNKSVSNEDKTLTNDFYK